jgi:hypothetical protein
VASTAAATSLPLDARGGRNNNQKAKEKGKKKNTNTNCQKLPHRIATARQPSMREKRNKVFPASCACFSSRSSSACLPTCLSDSRSDFFKLFYMRLRGCVQRADFARGRQVRNEEDDDGLFVVHSLSPWPFLECVHLYENTYTNIHTYIHNIQALEVL